MSPADLATLRTHPATPIWLLRLWENVDNVGARPKDFLSPLTVKHDDTTVMATARFHKTSRRGLRQPPIEFSQPMSQAARFLVARGHPTQPRHLFPECPSTRHLRAITRRFLPNLHLYAGRIAFSTQMAQTIPTEQLSKLMGHAMVSTTNAYVRSVITSDQRQRAGLLRDRIVSRRAVRTSASNPPSCPRY